jgi:hypothetical protein
MNRHPAHQIAETIMYAAEELRGYMNPDDPFPWELTDDDHLGLLPRLRKAIWDITECIDGIAGATPGERVKGKLTKSIQDLQAGCDGLEEAEQTMKKPEPETGSMTQPAALAASSFPQPMTGHMLQAATRTTALPSASPAAVPCRARTAQGKPGRRKAGRRTGRVRRRVPRKPSCARHAAPGRDRRQLNTRNRRSFLNYS